MSDELDEIVSEFIVETGESLDDVDRELVTLEQQATPESLARIFRAVHTVKGTSGFLGFSKLESVTHAGENLLSKLRDGVLEIDQDITTALLTMVDAVREIVASIESSGTEGDVEYDELVAELDRLERDDPRPVEEAVEIAAVPDAGFVAATQVEQPAEQRSTSADSIRVDVGLLDDLMNLVGELVLARNQILQYTATQNDSTFMATTQRLNLITTELQEGVMKTRMQPIENVWNKFPRVVRDLSATCGKRARLEMEGKHTELDKSLLEAIKDPLTHLVRNAVDHGLEAPEDRDANNKAVEGVVRLRSYHEGGQVIIEISDDGTGIDPAVIRRKAVEKGILTADEAAARSDRHVLDLIFRPGFSTATQVSNISGRGVGMDVVRTNIESIGGSVDVHSVLGEGTTFKIKIPLTLAIIPALVVTCGGERYAIPQVSLLELVHADTRQDGTQIEYVHGAPVFRLRGRLLPLVFLNEVLGNGEVDPTDTLNIVVLQADEQQFGLVVDQINDTAEIVVKPLGRLLKQATGFSGATIMGDGLVALILDVVGLAQHAQVSNPAARSRPDTERGTGGSDVDGTDRAEHTTVLLVGVDDRRFALPLDAVARLEELPREDVRDAGNHQVIHYRDAILPLVSLADSLRIRSSSTADSLQVLVCGTPEHQVGLIVDSIHDIAEHRFEVSTRTTTRGISGTAVVHGEVTDVLDLAALLGSVVFEPAEEAA